MDIHLTALLIVAFLILNSGVACCLATLFLPPICKYHFLSLLSHQSPAGIHSAGMNLINRWVNSGSRLSCM